MCVQVRSVAPDPSGQWLLSGADDGCVKLWEVRGRGCKVAQCSKGRECMAGLLRKWGSKSGNPALHVQRG